MQMTARFLASLGVVTKMISPQTIGVDPARAGRGARHVWLSAEIVAGSLPGSAVPLNDGPRHCGQSARADHGVPAMAKNATAKVPAQREFRPFIVSAGKVPSAAD